MAREFIEVLSSDLSGVQSDDVVGVSFSLDGKSYEIDLTTDEKAELEATLKPYVAKARKATSSKAQTRSGKPRRSKEEVAAARSWLQLRSEPVGDRGRIKAEYWDMWEKAGRPGL